MSLSKPINFVLAIIKWPTAIVALLILPATVMAAWSDVVQFAPRAHEMLPFAGGWLVYLVAWKLLFGRRLAGSLFSTIEHELTHAVFAWLTLHWVTGFKATWNRGGEVRYIGGGNWLISIAPYWFPTLCAPVMILMVLGTVEDTRLMSGLLGLTLAYHMTSTWRETHAEQPDLHETGFVFAWMFLPTANIAAYCLVTIFALDGLDGMTHFLTSVHEQSGRVYAWSGLQLNWD